MVDYKTLMARLQAVLSEYGITVSKVEILESPTGVKSVRFIYEEKENAKQS